MEQRNRVRHGQLNSWVRVDRMSRSAWLSYVIILWTFCRLFLKINTKLIWCRLSSSEPSSPYNKVNVPFFFWLAGFLRQSVAKGFFSLSLPCWPSLSLTLFWTPFLTSQAHSKSPLLVPSPLSLHRSIAERLHVCVTADVFLVLTHYSATRCACEVTHTYAHTHTTLPCQGCWCTPLISEYLVPRILVSMIS